MSGVKIGSSTIITENRGDVTISGLDRWILTGNINIKYKLLGFEDVGKSVHNLIVQSHRVGDSFLRYSKIFANSILKDCREFEYSFEKAKENYAILRDWLECTEIIDSEGFLLHPTRFYKEMKYSIFLKCRYPIPLSEFEFCKTLHDYAIEMLSKSKFSFFIDNADAKKLNEYKLKLLSFNSRVLSIKKEREYTALVHRWIFGQVEYIKSLQEFKQTQSTTDNLPKTIQIESLTEQQIKNLRKNLIDRLLIENIKEEDFIYLFSGKPIVDNMKKITPTKKLSNSMLYSLFKKEIQTDPIPIKQINQCFRLNSEFTKNSCGNTPNRGYAELKNILQ